MKKILILAAAALFAAACGSPKGEKADDGQQLFIGDDIAVAQTQYGKVRGYILHDIYQFKGIPYGAPTGGKNRFMPPQKPEPWEGIRNAYNYGESAPQVVGYPREPESAAFLVDAWNYDLIGEDCLRLNVWTPKLDAGKRPVIVWLHGGGFSSGNAIEQNGYGGENLAKYGDVVFCSVNHRLNAFGYSDFASVGGEKYLHSGNVGMLDIVAALQWIHDNIANFGGDPGNVTVIGQSGGGSKVSMIAAMPAAKGLVHKGVALSGNSVRGSDKASAEKDPQRKAELERMADGLAWLSENPARNFWEAVQGTMMYQVMIQIESVFPSPALGRFDQYTWPYLKKDLEEGRITLDEAQEIVDAFFLKHHPG